MTQTSNGSCLCGRVAYRIEGGFDAFYLCHCQRCRKASGSAHAANLFSTTAQITWLSGAEDVRSYRVPETRNQRSFCIHCGGAVPDIQQGGGLLVVPAGGLDTPPGISPTAHIFCDARAEWDRDQNDTPRLAGLPSQGSAG